MKTLTKIIFSIAVLAMLGGCESSSEETTSNYSLPTGLSDCKIWNLRSNGGGILSVIRCPNSTTTTSRSKSPQVTLVDEGTPEPEYEVVINGEKYKAVKQTK